MWNIIRMDARWLLTDEAVDEALKTALAQLQISESKEVAIVLANDATIQPMNAQFRGKDKPTNVLSFPSDAPQEWGDIVLSYDTIIAEAEAQAKTLHEHTIHMLIHGFLHLLGYDHLEQAEAEAMECLEIKILQHLAIANPYLALYDNK